MRRSIIASPEEFSLSPLLALLPVRSKIARLEELTSSLFARFERVSALLKEQGEALDAETRQRYLSEEAMLKIVLEWLEVKPSGES